MKWRILPLIALLFPLFFITISSSELITSVNISSYGLVSYSETTKIIGLHDTNPLSGDYESDYDIFNTMVLDGNEGRTEEEIRNIVNTFHSLGIKVWGDVGGPSDKATVTTCEKLTRAGVDAVLIDDQYLFHGMTGTEFNQLRNAVKAIADIPVGAVEGSGQIGDFCRQTPTPHCDFISCTIGGNPPYPVETVKNIVDHLKSLCETYDFPKYYVYCRTAESNLDLFDVWNTTYGFKVKLEVIWNRTEPQAGGFICFGRNVAQWTENFADVKKAIMEVTGT